MEEYWPKLKASVSSSLEEPLLEPTNMNASPQPKFIAQFFRHIGSAGLWPLRGQSAGA